MGIKLLFERAHESQRLGADLAIHIVAFDPTDAVFTGKRAPQREHQIEHRVETGRGVARLGGVLGVEQQIGVNVAVTGMAEVDDGDRESF